MLQEAHVNQVEHYRLPPRRNVLPPLRFRSPRRSCHLQPRLFCISQKDASSSWRFWGLLRVLSLANRLLDRYIAVGPPPNGGKGCGIYEGNDVPGPARKPPDGDLCLAAADIVSRHPDVSSRPPLLHHRAARIAAGYCFVAEVRRIDPIQGDAGSSGCLGNDRQKRLEDCSCLLICRTRGFEHGLPPPACVLRFAWWVPSRRLIFQILRIVCLWR